MIALSRPRWRPQQLVPYLAVAAALALGVAMIVFPPRGIEFRYQHPRHVMFFVRLVHDVFADMCANGRIEDLLLNRRVNLEGLAQVVGLALGSPEFQRR